MDRLRRRIFEVLDEDDGGTAGERRAGRWCNAVIVVLILANTVAVMAATVDEVSQRYGTALLIFEIVSVAVFTVEYVLRLWVVPEHPAYQSVTPARARLRYALTPLALIDLAAILPAYLAAVIPFDLLFLRLFRLLRIFKLVRYSPALGVMAAVARREQRTVVGALCVLIVLVVVSSAVVYQFEHDAQPDSFASVPSTIWWAVATLSTVGYGDAVPVTIGGRIVGGIVMILGIATFAVWTSIFASGFMEETRKRGFVVSWRMVARVPAFARLDAQRIAAIADLLTLETVPPRYAITRRGEPADCMYFVLNGEVEVDIGPKVIRLGPGSFFGELALLEDTARQATVTSITECNLLRLDSRDFRHLMAAEPAFAEAVRHIAEERAAQGAVGVTTREVAEQVTPDPEL
jgi:voltage-gated potassium channel